MTSAPSDFSLTRSMKSRATLKFTSASSNAMRTSRNESATLLSEILPSPRRSLKTFCNLLVRLSNIGVRSYDGTESTPSRNSRARTDWLNFPDSATLQPMDLRQPDLQYLRSAVGWLELGNAVEALAE